MKNLQRAICASGIMLCMVGCSNQPKTVPSLPGKYYMSVRQEETPQGTMDKDAYTTYNADSTVFEESTMSFQIPVNSDSINGFSTITLEYYAKISGKWHIKDSAELVVAYDINTFEFNFVDAKDAEGREDQVNIYKDCFSEMKEEMRNALDGIFTEKIVNLTDSSLVLMQEGEEIAYSRIKDSAAQPAR